MKQVTITVHRTTDGSVHCWFEDTENVPPVVEEEIEQIESEAFVKERDEDPELFDNLPAEGTYDHAPIRVGTVSYDSDGVDEITIDLGDVREQLESHNYL